MAVNSIPKTMVFKKADGLKSFANAFGKLSTFVDIRKNKYCTRPAKFHQNGKPQGKRRVLKNFPSG